ncbi:MAG: thioredoxin family protein [Georgfuchsia sp.]
MSKTLVACLCAEWCDTCRNYRPDFEALGKEYLQYRFVWIDIEDQGDLVIDIEIENFPTLLVAHGNRLLFAGTMLPHIGHLHRLLLALNEKSEPQIGTLSSAELTAFKTLAVQLGQGEA